MMDQTLAELVRAQGDHLEAQVERMREDLSIRIEQLSAEQEQLGAAVLARIDAHEEHHRRHEHRWGLVKLASRYPFRFAAIACALALAASGQALGANGGMIGLALQIKRFFGP